MESFQTRIMLEYAMKKCDDSQKTGASSGYTK